VEDILLCQKGERKIWLRWLQEGYITRNKEDSLEVVSRLLFWEPRAAAWLMFRWYQIGVVTVTHLGITEAGEVANREIARRVAHRLDDAFTSTDIH
jgi:hypothetical protein